MHISLQRYCVIIKRLIGAPGYLDKNHIAAHVGCKVESASKDCDSQCCFSEPDVITKDNTKP